MSWKIRIWSALLIGLTIQLVCGCIITAGAETHISKRIATLGESYIDIDVDAPAEPPATVPQIKVERVRFKRKEIKEVLDKYRPAPQKGESWQFEISSSLNPDFGLIWCEENGLYGPFWCYEDALHTPLDETDESLRVADMTARAFLNELGLPYEYPFYVVAPMGKEGRDAELIRIAARLTLDGIPCNTTIGWTRYSNGGGNGDATPGAFLTMTRDGKLGTAIIRNPVKIIECLDDTTPIRDWESILEADKERIMDWFCTGEDAGSTFTLKQVQFVMMVDARQNAYPAWTYIFDRYMPANNNRDSYTYHYQITYDAWTGEPVW